MRGILGRRNNGQVNTASLPGAPRAIELPRLLVSVANQELLLEHPEYGARTYRVSTARNGPGCVSGSYCTPTGAHVVRCMIGHDRPLGAVFRERRFTGEIFNEALRQAFPGRDWILTRILWLQGLEPGVNRGGPVDTFRRFIYIHGTADEDAIGRAESHGCIRMRNADMAELFALVVPGTPVHIE
jgi:L,D-transpeptidase YbiS